RRGISLIIVVLLVSMTMAVSFAVIHTQGTAITTQQNADLRASARAAALTGMAVAIREAHSPDWIGTEVSFSKSLGTSELFNATYSTGDATLSDGDDDYDEYAYRVTILVTGHATDPNNTDRTASHQIEAVIRLVPEAVDNEPTGWGEIQQNTFCQRENGTVSLTVPCRIEGPVRIRGKLDLCKNRIAWDDNLRTWYLDELYSMSQNGWPDYRPFNGPMYLPYGEQDAGTTDLLSGALHVPITDTTNDSLYAWSDPLLDESYQLYPGGKTYYAEIIGGDISDTELKPDPKTNPLGIFICSDDIRFLGNVSIQGTLITRDSDDIEITSGNNQFSSLTVPPYEHRGVNTDARFRLPTVIGDNDFSVSSGVMLQVNGLIMLRQGVEIKKASQYGMSVTINGNVSAKWLQIDIRNEWDMSEDWWEERLSIFLSMYYPDRFFPDLVNTAHGLNPQPQIQIKPDSDQTRYHWYSGDNPLFQKPSDDKGLTWEIIRWTDNP
ncbi:MAG: hypothetical protein U9N87_13485, partial [Planctomycetota bacterium]|nr:hypothetical protein [Planctomycetota bacterium]